MGERGAFHSRERASQLISFIGLQYGRITPTDIDAYIDFQGRGFVFVEVKHGDAPMARGQELALERVAEACAAGGVETLVLLATHAIDIGDVRLADAIVIRLYHAMPGGKRGNWRPPRNTVTVKQAADQFHTRCAKEAAA